ncbi:hypothetical protein [Gelidibacter salicanalis]|uniref:Uncharacterized protein n=1 Tax=Gelidibacter salicanalis TaxID=291193 RepID=A0A934NJ46_9FLAO|nr:hypothetical protein [Gelidibacter salicanalis]MBJ7882013.1 hypothetical protein [Gelidibacter salicanalis]
MKNITTFLKINIGTLVLLFAVCFFAVNDNSNAVSETGLADVAHAQNTSNIKVWNLASMEMEEFVATINKIPDYEHFSKNKRDNIENPTKDLPYLISYSNGINTGSKIGLFILYSSIKIPS